MRGAVWEYIRAVYSHTVLAGTSTIFALIATFYGLSGGQSLAVGALAGIAIALFTVASFHAWNEQRSKVASLSASPDRARAATAFREVLQGANLMFHDGTVGCRDGTDADAWIPKYEAWLEEAKRRIATDAGEDESVAVFLIGGDSVRGLEQVNGHNSEATRKLTFLKHHMGQLKDGLRRYLPSERRA